MTEARPRRKPPPLEPADNPSIAGALLPGTAETLAIAARTLPARLAAGWLRCDGALWQRLMRPERQAIFVRIACSGRSVVVIIADRRDERASGADRFIGHGLERVDVDDLEPGRDGHGQGLGPDHHRPLAERLFEVGHQ